MIKLTRPTRKQVYAQFVRIGCLGVVFVGLVWLLSTYITWNMRPIDAAAMVESTFHERRTDFERLAAMMRTDYARTGTDLVYQRERQPDGQKLPPARLALYRQLLKNGEEEAVFIVPDGSVYIALLNDAPPILPGNRHWTAGAVSIPSTVAVPTTRGRLEVAARRSKAKSGDLYRLISPGWYAFYNYDYDY